MFEMILKLFRMTYVCVWGGMRVVLCTYRYVYLTLYDTCGGQKLTTDVFMLTLPLFFENEVSH